MDGDAVWTIPGARRTPSLHFGAACFDPAALRLTIDGQEVALEQRPMALLSLLLARRGEVVSKYQIMEALWPGRTVTEASLTKCVGRLRAALGDHEHDMIHTVHGTGYRFDAAVTDQPPAPDPTLGPTPGPAIASTAQAVAPPIPQELPAPVRRTRAWWAAGAACFTFCLVLGAAVSVTRPPRRGPPPPQARALYMTGLQDWAQRTPAGLTRAVEEFTAALRISPGYADAYVGLATCYDLMPEYAAMPGAQAYPLARAASARAIALQPDLAAAHAAYAFALFWGDWDFAGAMAEYDRAMHLAPENATIQHWYATSLDVTGAHAQALAHIDRALELDPASPSIQADRGLILFNGGRTAEARAVLLALEVSAPDFLPPHAYLADIAHAAGDETTYLREEAIHLRLQHDSARLAVLDAAASGLASGGSAGMRRAVVQARLAAYAAGTVAAADVARGFAALGDKRQALAYLSLAIDRHDPMVISVLNDPEWRAYLDDPATVALLARIGLVAHPR